MILAKQAKHFCRHDKLFQGLIQASFKITFPFLYFAGSTNRLAPPKSFDPDASLETVDLNEDDTGLEKFLSDDLLYDVSPLPKDDEDKLPRLTSLKKEGSRETLQNEIQSLEESALYDTSRNPIIQTQEFSSDEEICQEID